MGRHLQPEIRQRLLNACTDHALAHGLPDRLEPLAAAAGTSSRMLIYHFGTRDSLLREVLGAARQRQVADWTDLMRLRPDEPYSRTLAQAWTAISGPHGRPYLRMFNRLHDTAGQPHWPGFRRTATTDWLAPLEHGLASLGRPELATVLLAVLRGLLMDQGATGDTARTDQAFSDFLATLGAPDPTNRARDPGGVSACRTTEGGRPCPGVRHLTGQPRIPPRPSDGTCEHRMARHQHYSPEPGTYSTGAH